MTESWYKAKRFLGRQQGATMAEYALLLGLVAVVCIGAALGIGRHASAMFQSVAGQF